MSTAANICASTGKRAQERPDDRAGRALQEGTHDEAVARRSQEVDPERPARGGRRMNERSVRMKLGRA